MSIKRIYACDICRDEETPRGHQGKDVALIGFEFGKMDRIEQKGSREVERHICKHCLQGLYKLACESGVMDG